MRKTKSYVTKEKIFKSVKGLLRNFKKFILKNSQFFANISKLRQKLKHPQNKQCSPICSLSLLNLLTFEMGTPCIWGIDAIKIFSELVGDFKNNPIFHFFEILKNFSFLRLSRELFEIS